MAQRVVVVTGASSGIGAALARQLGARGDRVVLAARRKELLDRVAAESGPDAIAVQCDVTKRADVVGLRDRAVEKCGHVDVWVNNAGWATSKKVMDLGDSELQAVIDVVLKSVVYGMQAIVPHFIERGKGHIINVSSAMGRVPFVTYRSIYSASKSAVNILTSNLRVDLSAHPGIKVSLVLPGIVDTDFHRVAETPQPMKAGTKMGPLTILTADEVAAKVVELMDNPVPELYVPPDLAEVVRQYYSDVGAFEARAGRR